MRRERSTNEYTFGIFFLLNLIITLFATIWYENNMLINLKIGPLNLNKFMSVNFFIIFVMIFYVVGLLFTMDRYRTKIQLAVNAFLPLEIYTLILYFNVWPFFVRGTIVGTVTVVVLFLILYLYLYQEIHLQNYLRY